MNTKHAYYDGHVLMFIEGSTFSVTYPLLSLPNTLDAIADMAYTHFITHLWVMPTCEYVEVYATSNDWQFSSYNNRKDKVMGCNVRKRGHKNTDVNIIFPQHTAWYGDGKVKGWMCDVEPHDFLIALLYIEKVLGVTVSASPGRVGWNYLKKLHPDWIEDVDIDLAACHFTKHTVADIIWQRPLIPGEGQLKYLHKFDKNSAYPYAASTAFMGVGTPVYVEHGNDALAMNDKQSVGVWRCTVKKYGVTWMNDGDKRGDWKDGDCWLMGPIIRLLRTAGHGVTVHEGYVFPEKHQLLATWANNLWMFRQDFTTPGKWKSASGARLAAKAMKQIANSMLGMTAFSKFEDEDDMKRPDIRLQTIARHRELTYHNIAKIRKERAISPVIVYMDAVYYLSDEQDGRKAFPELVKREDKLGGYKWEGCIPMEKADLVLYSKQSESSKLETLNQIGWVK